MQILTIFTRERENSKYLHLSKLQTTITTMLQPILESEDNTQMTLFLKQNQNDNFISVSQGNFQNKESLFHSYGIIKSNHNHFTMLYNFNYSLILSKAKQ